jgi:UDP-N-acetylmuramyl tripeptide synthase
MHHARATSGAFRRRLRRGAAVAAARGATTLSRLAGHDATALPGLVAERIDPSILAALGGSISPVVLVVGTNGKTTTTRLTARILATTLGCRPISNPSGANLAQGIVTALVAGRHPRIPSPAVFEVDEWAFSRVSRALHPDVVVILNVVRDQLDRFGEIDAVADRWRRDLAWLDARARLVVCADDPRVEAIACATKRPIWRFGLSCGQAAGSPIPAPDPPWSAADSAPCPRCEAPMNAGVGGDWRCLECGLARSPLDLGVRVVGLDAGGGIRLAFDGPLAATASGDPLPTVRVGLDGAAGAYDTAAAVLTAICLGADAETAARAVNGATPAFGRLEELRLEDRGVVLTLAKNPVSAAQAAEAVATRRPDHLLIGLGDRPADGRDVSWIWDAPLDALPAIAPTTLTGSRADDLALRFKYGRDVGGRENGEEPRVEADLERALDGSLGRLPPNGTLMVLGTYTTLLGIRKILERRGLAPAFPR